MLMSIQKVDADNLEKTTWYAQVSILFLEVVIPSFQPLVFLIGWKRRNMVTGSLY